MVTWKKKVLPFGEKLWLWKQGNGGLWQHGTSNLQSQPQGLRVPHLAFRHHQQSQRATSRTPSLSCLVLGLDSGLGWCYSCPSNINLPGFCHLFLFWLHYYYLHAYVHVCVCFVSRCLKRPERGVRFFRARCTSVCMHAIWILWSVGGTKVLVLTDKY